MDIIIPANNTSVYIRFNCHKKKRRQLCLRNKGRSHKTKLICFSFFAFVSFHFFIGFQLIMMYAPGLYIYMSFLQDLLKKRTFFYKNKPYENWSVQNGQKKKQAKNMIKPNGWNTNLVITNFNCFGFNCFGGTRPIWVIIL